MEQMIEKSISGKNKKTSHKIKKKMYLEIGKEERKNKVGEENINFEENIINSKRRKYKSNGLYQVENNNFMQEDGTRKEEKGKNKKMNSRKNKNSIDSNASDESKKLNNKKLSKLRKTIKKINSINTLNYINKYYQRWILQTFDVIEEEEEAQDEQDKDDNGEEKEEEEEEEEEENDYGGDLEEIEERAADEEESVITSVQSKTKVKRANDILFALRKIIKYKNIFFRYFMRWYNAVDINAPTNEYKKLRKDKKLNNGIGNTSSKKNINSNINNYNNELKQPIYEVSSEERIDELKTEVKVNLKNIIEFKGNKKSILKKYYDIWYNLTFNVEYNEYIFTYHGDNNRNNYINQRISKSQNIGTDTPLDTYFNNKSKDNGVINKTPNNLENANKQKTQCYVRKKIYSIKKGDIEKENKKKNKKKIKINDIIKNTFIKVNNKKLLYSAYNIWKKNTLFINEINLKIKNKY